MSEAAPSGWELTTLGRNAQLITDGAHASPPTHEGGRPIATVQNMGSRFIDFASCRLISENDFNSLVRGNCAPEVGDVLFSKDGTVGKTFVYRQSEKVVLLSSIAIIRLDESNIDPEFCSQFLLSPLFYQQLESAKSGSAIRRIVLNELKKIEIPRPPLPEQKKIAEILSSVDDMVEKIRAQLDKLKDLKAGMMQELLVNGIGPDGAPHSAFKDSPAGFVPAEWSVVELKEVAKVKGGKRMPKGRPFAENKTPYPYIRVSDFSNGTIKGDNLRYVLPEDRELIKRYTISKNDLYISIAGTIGVTGSVPDKLDGAQLTENAAKIVLTDTQRACAGFLKHLMSSNQVQDQLNQEKGTGGGVPKLALFRIESILIKLPPMREQIVIARSLDSIDHRLDSANKKLAALLLVKKALMQDLLTGKVRVKVD
ncbi:hypothetical protein BXT89_17175 [Halopseudomonas pachastrellae]|uniref:Type I restriction modification DNA specificity domain-containing protein n=1 Tax=Halopseudomonas pachastrellae TaxID=254161 RepID=A0A1S8DAY7_9GAMM|nr:restriction endonuclease subunit S [Halopseudomonas pachastrellae]ONM42595.1 hypothetical protein BXT89_17175 [Halopseudomonas pachastrellae]SFM12079.1 type I restriction enzyme, S subunit [Halopseudomonas pachastrellae]